jgi:CitMHS family citrate-Mg2+:H+ or citrate-Ca2+:H+ symporter
LVKGDPLKVIVGSAILAGIIGFDGDGSSTIMICFSALLPLYLRLGIKPIILAAITIMQIGITTLVPWGGPVGRVASVLKLDPTALYISLLPGMIVSLLYIVFIAYIIGKKERARLGIMNTDIDIETQAKTSATIEGDKIKRPKLIWVNFSLTAILMVALIMSWYPSAILFIVGTALALLINYPKVRDQADRISAHSSNALSVTTIILAAGIFSGILTGTAMSDAMAQGLVSIIPSELGAYMGLIVAIISGIGLFFIGPDGFYFGIIPVLAETASAYGISGMEIGTASLYGTPFGIIGPLVGAMYLLTGMAGVNLVDVQKYAGKFSLGILTIFIVFGLVLGHISV